MSFTARYHSTCEAGGDHISPGDTVMWLDDEVVHVLCTGESQPAATGETCATCWMLKPCFCEEDG